MDKVGCCCCSTLQVSLFENISPLFVNKPIIVTATKIDAQPWETLDPADKAKVRSASCTLHVCGMAC